MKKILLIVVVILMFISFSYFNVNDTIDSTTSADLFENYYSDASKILESMSLEEKVGQVFLARFDDCSSLDYYPAGYVLYTSDFEDKTKNTITDMINSCEKASKVGLIMAVDEEGGSVVRVSSNSNLRDEPFKSNQDLYNEGGFDLVLKTEKEKIELLSSIGINLNLAPVADIANKEDYIYNRTLGQDIDTTSKYISEVVRLYNESGLISVLKHFPGYGSNENTHMGISIDNRSYDEFLNKDFQPFISGIKNGSPCILISHNIVTSMDDTLPASLSTKVHEILTQELNFSGVIITDDLSMSAILNSSLSESPAVLALKSGNNLIITSDFTNMYQDVLTSLNNGKLSEDILDNAVLKVLAMKLKYDII